MQRIEAAFLSVLRRFARDDHGGVFVVFALSAPVLLGLMGFGLEGAALYRLKQRQQTAADTAAAAGAFERAKGNPDQINAAAFDTASRNGFTNASPTTIQINSPPTLGTYAGDPSAVEVIIQTSYSTIVSRKLLSPGATDAGIQVASRSVSKVDVTGEACVLSLDPAASAALTNNGSTNINLTGCVMAANSTSDTAINITGSSTVVAESLWSAGGYYAGGSADIQLNKPAMTNMWALPDPYKDVSVTPPSGCDYTNKKAAAGASTLSPGTYCGGLDFGSKADVTLEPGTYYINGGLLNFNAQAKVRCNCSGSTSGVTFVLTGPSPSDIATIAINGGADVDLRAPSAESDQYRGLLVIQDRTAPTSGVNKLNGGATQILNGAIYIPQQAVQWSGSTSSSTNCIQIIARTVTFIGNSALNDSGCAARGVKPISVLAPKLRE